VRYRHVETLAMRARREKRARKISPTSQYFVAP